MDVLIVEGGRHGVVVLDDEHIHCLVLFVDGASSICPLWRLSLVPAKPKEVLGIPVSHR